MCKTNLQHFCKKSRIMWQCETSDSKKIETPYYISGLSVSFLLSQRAPVNNKCNIGAATEDHDKKHIFAVFDAQEKASIIHRVTAPRLYLCSISLFHRVKSGTHCFSHLESLRTEMRRDFPSSRVFPRLKSRALSAPLKLEIKAQNSCFNKNNMATFCESHRIFWPLSCAWKKCPRSSHFQSLSIIFLVNYQLLTVNFQRF